MWFVASQDHFGGGEYSAEVQRVSKTKDGKRAR